MPILVVDIRAFDQPGRASVAEQAVTEGATVVIEQDKRPVLVMVPFLEWAAIGVAALSWKKQEERKTGADDDGNRG